MQFRRLAVRPSERAAGIIVSKRRAALTVQHAEQINPLYDYEWSRYADDKHLLLVDSDSDKSDAEVDEDRASGAGKKPTVVASSSAESVVGSSSTTTTVANTDSANDTDIDRELLN